MTPQPKATNPSAQLTDNETKLVQTLQRFGARSPEKVRTAEDIVREARLPKGQVMNWLQALERKGVVAKVQRGKSAGFYLVG